MADTFRPSQKASAFLYDAGLVLVSSVLIALSARCALPLPFSPVPVTGQTFAVLFLGALLGSRRGALSVCAYCAQGAAGLPFFAAGAGGLAWLLGPTGGYLFGFIGAAYCTGFLAEHGWDRSFLLTMASMLLGSAVLYCCGLLWLSRFLVPGKLLAAGFFPFIAGDFLKICMATALLPAGWKLLKKSG